MKILALDYDGVLVDSELESFVCGYNAYLRLTGTKKLKKKEPFTIDDFENIEEEYAEEHEKYKKLRPFFTNKLRFNLIMQIIGEGATVRNQKEFNDYGKNVKITNTIFKKQFHKERELLQNQDYEKWLKASKPFTVAIDNFRKIMKKFDKVVLLTANKKELIFKGLKRFGFNIRMENIFDAYFSNDKRKIMKAVRKKFKVDYSDIYFVDDRFSWMEMLSKMGVKCFLATWGYSTKEQWKKAEKLGVVLLKEDDIYEKVSKALKE